MHTQVKTQGIILKAVPYKDFHRIITLFTPDQGLVSLVVRGAFSPKKGSGGSTTPLTTVEVAYRQKDSSLHTCEQIDIVDLHLSLRQNLQALDAACGMLRAVMKSQLPDKEAPLLYQLLNFYITKLPHTLSPPTLTASFLLKTLRHEGLLFLPSECEHCASPLREAYLADGVFQCRPHGRACDVHLTQEEYDLLHLLAFCDTHSLLADLTLTKELQNKVEGIFTHLIR